MSMVLPNTWRFRSGIPEKIELSTFQNGCFCPAGAAQGGQGPSTPLEGRPTNPLTLTLHNERKNNCESLNSLVKNCEQFQATLKKLGFWTDSWRILNNSRSLCTMAGLQLWVFEHHDEELWTTWTTFRNSTFRVSEKQIWAFEQTAGKLWATWLTRDHFSQWQSDNCESLKSDE